MSPPNPLENLVALDADITDTLSASPPNPSIDPESAARVKRRILKRIAQTQAGHVTVHPSDSNWQPIHRGVDIKVLHQAGDILSYLLRLAPGAKLGAHRHRMDEECVVLEGRVRIGHELVLDAGGFHLAHEGALHAEITSDEGALLFLRGAAPHPSLIL